MTTICEKVNDIEEFYNAFSSEYDDTVLSKECDYRHIHETKKIFSRHQITDGEILDLGCGTGLLKESLGSKFKYTGIDISRNMLSLAKKRGYRTVHSSLEQALPNLADNTFDYCICLSALFLIQNAEQAIFHMKRVSRKGVIISLDELPEEYIQQVPCPAFDHTLMRAENTKDDYFFLGWTSPTLDIPIRTRIMHFGTQQLKH